MLLQAEAPRLLAYYNTVFLPAVREHTNQLERRALSGWPKKLFDNATKKAYKLAAKHDKAGLEGLLADMIAEQKVTSSKIMQAQGIHSASLDKKLVVLSAEITEIESVIASMEEAKAVSTFHP